MPGFIIKELSLLAKDKESATIPFKKGLNIISGPTGTGKSYIYQCLNYMLGSSKIPKPITEALSYETVVLTIETSDSTIYRLSSDLKGGNFDVFAVESKERFTLKRKHRGEEPDSVSTFLLTLINLSGKKIRTNAKGKTRPLYYRDLARLIMVDENRIIIDESLVTSGQYTTVTEEKSTFKLIITGEDDSIVVAQPSKDEIKYRKGKIQMLTDLIAESAKDLSLLPDAVEPEARVIRIDEQLNTLRQNHDNLKNSFTDADSERNTLNNELSQLNNERIYNEELLKRSKLLVEQYKSDQRRLTSTIEASILLMENPGTEDPCPICGRIMEAHNHEGEISAVIEACELEVTKTSALINEVAAAETALTDENNILRNKIGTLETKILEIGKSIENGIGLEMENILNQITELNGIKANANRAIFLKERIRSYEFQLNALKRSIGKNGDGNFDGLSALDGQILSDHLKAVLLGIQFPNVNSVYFSEETYDFVISGEQRSLKGKGLRAITYASFLIALQELVESKAYKLGPCILDSPLVTYRKPKADGEGISTDLAMDFYRYLAKDNQVPQTIILENEEPPEDVLDSINHIPFSGTLNSGRYGFIPL